MHITFLACDKGSSAYYSKSAEVETKEQLIAEWKEFEKEVPFKRWYTDHTNDSDNPEVDKWLEELEDSLP